MKPGRLGVALTLAAALPLAGGQPVEIHPAGPTVPENLLRFELRFDRPQSLPFDVGRLRLVDGEGVEIRHALLDVALPDRDGRRIAVLMDPGRVKSGVGPNRDAGRALSAGTTVSLLVAGGPGGGPAVVKTWQVTAALLQPLQPGQWQLSRPRRGTRDALRVDLRTPISSVGEQLIAVLDGRGRRVDGRMALSDGDTTWRFKPSRPWAGGPHRLVTHPGLEDPAGNRHCAAFEAPLQGAASCEGTSLAFTPQRAF